MASQQPLSAKSQQQQLKPKGRRLKEVKRLGRELLTSRSYVNNLPILLTFISPTSPPTYVLESLLSLQSFFTPLLPHLPPSSSSSEKIDDDDNDAEVIYRTWLRSKFDEFVKLLVEVVVSPHAEDALKEVVLDALMDFVKTANGGKFHSAIYHRLLHNIVRSTNPVDVVLELLTSKYFSYIDIRYFTYISLEKFATLLEGKDMSDDKTESATRDRESNSMASMETCIRNLHYIMSHIPPQQDLKENSADEMWGGSGFSFEKGDSKDLSELPKGEDKQLKSRKLNNSVLSAANIAKKMKLKFTKAWISFLRLPLPIDVYKEVLVTLHQAVIPHLSNPIMLSDFLTRSYDIGGVVSVMALSSLFILMTQHGLEYPNFYEKLYALLLPSIFMAKHRAKFFELLDSCLKSPLLPAYLAAAFAKKLSRLALVVPPSGALVIVALIHNLLRRHPSINCLVHREDTSETANANSEAERETADKASNSKSDISTRLGIDRFVEEESNPAKSNALRSSLWEVDTLRHHYCPPVSRFVLSLENDLTVRAKTTEVDIKDFSSGSYATIFGAEIRRRVKQVPLAVYKTTPTSLFSQSDFSGWTFEHKGSKEKNEINDNTDELNDYTYAKRQRIQSS